MSPLPLPLTPSLTPFGGSIFGGGGTDSSLEFHFSVGVDENLDGVADYQDFAASLNMFMDGPTTAFLYHTFPPGVVEWTPGSTYFDINDLSGVVTGASSGSNIIVNFNYAVEVRSPDFGFGDGQGSFDYSAVH